MSDLDTLRKKVKRAAYSSSNSIKSEPCTVCDLEKASGKLVDAMLAIVDEIEAMQRE